MDHPTAVAAPDVEALTEGAVAPPAAATIGSAPVGTTARILVRGVTRQFTRGRIVDALGPVDLEVGEAEFVSIVGPSGCGKSTLLRVIAGLLPPSAGHVDVAHLDASRSLCAIVPQENSLFPWKTVERNVRFGLDVARRGSRRARKAVVDELLARMGLSEFARSFPHQLSGGMKQRVGIARALAVEPEVLLMDEPFAALDAQLRLLMQNDLVALWETDRRTVVFVTHSIEEALVLSDRVLVCSARPGRLIAEFPVPFARPRDVTVRGSVEFAALQQEIWELVRQEVDAQMRDRLVGSVASRRPRRWRR